MPERDWEAAYRDAVETAAALHEEHHALVAEHQALLREAHHRARNHLQLLAGSVRRRIADTTSSDVRQLGQQIVVQIHSVARLYERLAAARGDVDLAGYLAGLCADLGEIAGNPLVRLDVRAAPVTVPADHAVPLGLIASELVTNAYTHAFRRRRSGNITVALQADAPRHLALSVADTGDGFGPDFVKRGGCRMVEALAHRMGGSVSYGAPPGAHVTVRLGLSGAPAELGL